MKKEFFRLLPFLIGFSVLLYQLIKTGRMVFGLSVMICSVIWLIVFRNKSTENVPDSRLDALTQSQMELFESTGKRLQEVEDQIENVKIALSMKSTKSIR